MCKILSVNEKGYYKKLKVGKRILKWQKLLSEIHKILNEDINNDNYGAKRILLALQQKGIKTSLSSVRRAMQPENLIKRDFTASKPNEKWLTDITQVNCKDGKLYIAPIFDCFSGEIVSLAMDRNMKKELCISALEAAFKARKPKTGVIVHSDAGSQYTSYDYKSTIGMESFLLLTYICLHMMTGVMYQTIIVFLS